jgi:hypothetical protein
VELQEAFAACQARLEASLHETNWERVCWEAGTLAGPAYGVTQHVLRPLWMIHCKSEFPLDRCAVWDVSLNLCYIVRLACFLL